jgi:hypothetical protein
MDFDRFVAPLGAERFVAEHWGERAAHLRAAEPGRLTFGWADFNALFANRPFWTPGNTRVVLNSKAIPGDFYLSEVRTLDGVERLADPAKLDHFMGMGASLVAHGAEAVVPAIRQVAETLAARFAAQAQANVYCSFKGVRAFHTHYDDHEVFAVQCEGEKLWRLYANRHPRPWEPMSKDQAVIDAARGPVALEVTTRPGDLLYIPRGQYHDAIAVDSDSLHVTFSVTPMSGFLLGRVLDEALRADPAFGAYLPSPDEEDGRALQARLAQLADRVAQHAKSYAVAVAVADAQRRLAVPRHAVTLPERAPQRHFARTDRPATLSDGPDGTILHIGDRRVPTGPAFGALHWILSRPAFSDVELAAEFPQVAAGIRGQVIDLLIAERVFEPYQPSV